MNGTPDDWPRMHYARLRDLDPADRPAALAAVPARLRDFVSLYLSMPESEFALMKLAARIARMNSKEKRIAALNAIEDPKARARIRATARDLFYQGRP